MIPVTYDTFYAVRNIWLEEGLSHEAQFLPLQVLIWAVLLSWIIRENEKKAWKKGVWERFFTQTAQSS